MENTRCGSDNITVFKGVIKFASSDQSTRVRDIGHKIGSMLIGRRAEVFVVPITGIRRCTTDYQSGLKEFGISLEFLVIYELGGRIEAVRKGLEVDGGCRYFFLGGVVSMGEMSTVGEAKTHYAVLGVNEGSECGKVGSLVRVF